MFDNNGTKLLDRKCDIGIATHDNNIVLLNQIKYKIRINIIFDIIDHIFVASDLILLLILYTTAKGADISTKGYIISPNHILFSKNMCNTPYFRTTVKVYNSKIKMILYKIFFISFYQYGIKI